MLIVGSGELTVDGTPPRLRKVAAMSFDFGLFDLAVIYRRFVDRDRVSASATG
jgi:hypothetical protein